MKGCWIAVLAKYGKDSSEYEQAGGKKKANGRNTLIRRKTRNPAGIIYLTVIRVDIRLNKGTGQLMHQHSLPVLFIIVTIYGKIVCAPSIYFQQIKTGRNVLSQVSNRYLCIQTVSRLLPLPYCLASRCLLSLWSFHHRSPALQGWEHTDGWMDIPCYWSGATNGLVKVCKRTSDYQSSSGGNTAASLLFSRSIKL